MTLYKLDKKHIEAGFNGPKHQLNVEILDEVSSTNDVAKQLLVEQPDTLSLIATNKQTAGKGRSGKSFYSELEHGLYFTLAFQPNDHKIENVPLYTILSATALVEVLENYVDEPVSIKWVNDIFYKRRKISGILSEMVVNEAVTGVPGVVVGIGLNIAGDFSQTEKAVQSVAGTLFGHKTPDIFNQNEFLSHFINQFYSYHENFQARSFMPIYENHLLGIGQEVHYSTNGKKHRGVIQGINEEGHLLVLKPDQTVEALYGQAVHFGSKQFTNEK